MVSFDNPLEAVNVMLEFSTVHAVLDEKVVF